MFQEGEELDTSSLQRDSYPCFSDHITANQGIIPMFVQGKTTVQIKLLMNVQGKIEVRGRCSGQIEGQNQPV